MNTCPNAPYIPRTKSMAQATVQPMSLVNRFDDAAAPVR